MNVAAMWARVPPRYQLELCLDGQMEWCRAKVAVDYESGHSPHLPSRQKAW